MPAELAFYIWYYRAGVIHNLGASLCRIVSGLNSASGWLPRAIVKNMLECVERLMAEQIERWGADPRLGKLMHISHRTVLRELNMKDRMSENDLLNLCQKLAFANRTLVR